MNIVRCPLSPQREAEKRKVLDFEHLMTNVGKILRSFENRAPGYYKNGISHLVANFLSCSTATY